MANVEAEPKGRKGKPTQKKKSTRIDMTAMVDVAFLLLTFFVLTAVMDKNVVMELVNPPIDGEHGPVDEEKIMTLILDENNIIKYFHGATDPQVFETTYDGLSGIRKVIFDHMGRYANRCTERDENKKLIVKDCWHPIFVIKPRYTSSYGNLVDILDEMAIAHAPTYAIDTFSEADSLLLLDADLKLQSALHDMDPS